MSYDTSASHSSEYFLRSPLEFVSLERDNLLIPLQRLILASQLEDKDFADREEGHPAVDQLLDQGEPYDESITTIVRPARFHGAITGLTATVTDIAPEHIAAFARYPRGQYRKGVLLDVVACATSTRVREAGSFRATVLYYTTGREAPRPEDLPPTRLQALGMFPVKRKVMNKPLWQDDASFPDNLDRLARMSDGANPVTTRMGRTPRRKKS